MHRRKKVIQVAPLLMALVLVTHWVSAAETLIAGSDWAHWKGPLFNSCSPEKGLLRAWPKEGPAVLWRAPIEQGWSCPTIAGNDVYLIGAKFIEWNKAEESIVCLDAKTGAKRWEHKYMAFPYYCGWASGGPRATPVITEKYVVTLGMIGHVFCLDRKSGAVVWKHELMQEYKDIAPIGRDSEWKGWNISPAAFGDVLFIAGPNSTDTPYGVNGLYGGFDLNTGKERWMHYAHEDGKGKLGPARWSERLVSAACPIKFQNQECILTSINLSVRVLNPQDGKELAQWKLQTFPGQSNGLPQILQDGSFLGQGGLSEWMQYDVDLNVPVKTTVRWQKKLPSADWMYGFAEHEGYLYGVVGGGADPNAIQNGAHWYGCIDLKNGEIKWAEKTFPLGTSHLLADGLLFIRSYQTLHLAEAVPTGYVEKGRVENLHDDKRRSVSGAQGLSDWVQPVLSRGQLYIRTPKELICFKVDDDKLKTAHKP